MLLLRRKQETQECDICDLSAMDVFTIHFPHSGLVLVFLLHDLPFLRFAAFFNLNIFPTSPTSFLPTTPCESDSHRFWQTILTAWCVLLLTHNFFQYLRGSICYPHLLLLAHSFFQYLREPICYPRVRLLSHHLLTHLFFALQRTSDAHCTFVSCDILPSLLWHSKMFFIFIYFLQLTNHLIIHASVSHISLHPSTQMLKESSTKALEFLGTSRVSVILPTKSSLMEDVTRSSATTAFITSFSTRRASFSSFLSSLPPSALLLPDILTPS